MTLLLGGNSIAEKILDLLAATPGLSAQELLAKAKQADGADISQSGLYKELRKLCEQGVLFKVGQTYRFHLNWVLELQNFSEAVQANYLDQSHFLPELPEEGMKVKWRLSNLYRMNDLFTNVVLRLVKETKAGLHLSWNYHPWFHLIQTKQEVVFFRALKRSKVRMYKIIGSCSPLDRWSEQFWDPEMVTWSYAESPFHTQRQTYFSVIGDFIVKVELTAKTARRLDDLYQSSDELLSKNLKSDPATTLIDPRILSFLLDDRSPTYLILSRNSREARSIRRKFENYFGKLEPG